MPVTKVRCRWDSGNQIFHESSSLATIADLLTIGTTGVTIGSATNDVDFKIFMGASDQYAEFNCGTATLTITKVDVALAGDLTVTLEDISVVQGKYIYLEGQAGASYIISDTAGDLMLNTTTNLNFALGGTDEVRMTATVFSPAVSDGNALGSTSLMWSDLFLASAGVINWNNGNCLITHAAGVLTVTGDIVASNAAGPAIEDEAATTTNPTLCPNKADLTTGIGWNTAEIHLVVSGVDEVNLSASALSPGVTDSTALGTTALMWSDLFLADAGVINWNNGDTTLTATGNLLTLGASGLSIGADGAGFDVIFYGDRTGSDFFWDQDGQTNGSLNLGTTTVSEGVDLFVHGDTADTYLHWDCSADDLLLVGAGLYFSGTQADEVIQIGGTYDHGIRFTEDPVGADNTNSFINIGDYGTAIAVAPTSAHMFGEMHNVSLTDVNVSYYYQAKYTKITTSGTTTNTSVAGHALRMQIGSSLGAVYGIQCHTNITATNTCANEIISVSAYVDLGAATVTTTDRVCALQAMIAGSGTAGTVVGDVFVAYIVNAGTVVTTDSIVNIRNQSAATAISAVEMEIDGTITYAFDFQGTVSNGWTTADAAVSQSNEYVLIPVRVAGVTPTLYIQAGETWS